MIVGAGALAAGALGAALALVDELNLVRDGWNGFNVLHTAAARIGGLMLGYAQTGGIADARGGQARSWSSCSAPTRSTSRRFAGQLQGLYRPSWRQGRARAPTSSCPAPPIAEKHGTYVNIEGRVQRQRDARSFPPGDAREDWTILRALVRRARQAAAVRQLRRAARRDVRAIIRDFAQPGLVAFDWAPPKLEAAKIAKGTALAYPIKDFYLTNAIARSTPTMQRCSAELHGQSAEAADEHAHPGGGAPE